VRVVRVVIGNQLATRVVSLSVKCGCPMCTHQECAALIVPHSLTHSLRLVDRWILDFGAALA
jgi:hypothetical protein